MQSKQRSLQVMDLSSLCGATGSWFLQTKHQDDESIQKARTVHAMWKVASDSKIMAVHTWHCCRSFRYMLVCLCNPWLTFKWKHQPLLHDSSSACDCKSGPSTKAKPTSVCNQNSVLCKWWISVASVVPLDLGSCRPNIKMTKAYKKLELFMQCGK